MRILLASCFALMAAMPAALQETKVEDTWTGSVERGGEKLFPNPTKVATLRLGAFRKDDEWAAFWKSRNAKAPKIDFDTTIVVFALNAVWPGECKMDAPKIEKGVATFVVDLGDEAQKKAFRCHYEYTCRVLSKKDLKGIVFLEKGKADVICKVDPDGKKREGVE